MEYQRKYYFNLYRFWKTYVDQCFYVENIKISYEINNLTEKLLNEDFQFNELLIGFNKFNKSDYSTNVKDFIKTNKVFNKHSELYQEKSFQELTKNCGIIDYLDTAETETVLIANFREDITKNTTHLEIHPSLILGYMGNQIVFPENNQLPRDLFSCGQSKQAVSII